MSASEDEALETLPAGHPQAGYVAPTLEETQGTGTVPDSEQEWYDDRVEAQKAENEAVASNEDEVAKAEAEPEPEPTPTKTSSKSGSSSSSSSEST